MYYRVLGPVAVEDDATPVAIERPRQRAVLAFLLLHRNTPVLTERLVRALWEDSPPGTARSQVQTDVSILRRCIRAAGGTDPVTTIRSGYVITVRPDELDLDRFTAQTRAAAALADPAARADRLRRALDLWTGPPISGITAAYAEAYRLRLDEDRVHALESLYDAELRAGRHAEIIADLLTLVAAYPLREALVGALMTALHRSGRTAEALERGRDLRRALADQHGLDPGSGFQALERAILRNESPPVTAASARPVPRQLPWHLPALAGRDADLARLDAITERGGLAVVTGTAGVGKTTLALHWAHRAADRYPDGQLYASLRGFDANPQEAQPSDVLGAFLVALGENARDLPADPGALAALFRSRTAGRRILIVLDNARDAEQVTPLLPAGGPVAVVVTSRDRLTGLVLAGAIAVPLDLLDAVGAADLLAARLPPGRVAAEPEAVAGIVAGCARLPLALSLVAAYAAARPEVPLADTAAALTRGELDAPVLADTFARSYARLQPEAAAAYLALGGCPLAEIGADAVASLIGVPAAQARSRLAELARASLVTELPGGRITMHDLLRADARARAQDTGPDALRRLLDHYTHTARRAAVLYQPVRSVISIDAPAAGVTVTAFADRHEALAWLAAERDNLILLATRAGVWGHDPHAWRLAWALTDYLHRSGWWHDWVRVQEAGLAAARRLDEPRSLTLSHAGLARALMQVRRFAAAERELRAARAAAVLGRDLSGEAYVLQVLADVHERLGRHHEAAEAAAAALARYESAGDRRGQAAALNNLAMYLGAAGRTGEAIERGTSALRLFTANSDVNGAGAAHDTLGRLHADAGDHGAAVRHYARSIEIKTTIGECYQAAVSRVRLAECHLTAGDVASAIREYRLALADLTDHPDADGVRARLAAIT